MTSSKDTLECVRDVALILFGLTAFLREIWLWTQQIAITIIFAIIIIAVLFGAGFLPKFIEDKDWKEDQKIKQGKMEVQR